ncbi:hypothetical protein V1525DRAFT_167723 [Lipomyces kononenkoae]|uniref:Uncharacterized protein n=1 Tax=Lipomyces kononenkoae TaxID=34357 RepID=A0ACC3T1B1_LIPKO
MLKEENTSHMNSSPEKPKVPKVTIVFKPDAWTSEAAAKPKPPRSNGVSKSTKTAKKTSAPQKKSEKPSTKKASSKSGKQRPTTDSSCKPKQKRAKPGTKKKAARKSPPIAVVEPPEFNPIITDLDEEELQCRLLIREYVLRFEKHCRLALKHINIVNDVTGQWGSSTFKALVVAILRIIYSDNFPIVPELLLKNAVKEVEKTASENERIWRVVCEVLESQREESELSSTSPTERQIRSISMDKDFEEPLYVESKETSVEPESPAVDSIFKTNNRDLEKLKLVQQLIFLSLSGNYIRETIEIDHESSRRKVIQASDEMKKMSETHAMELDAVRRQFLDMPPSKRHEWEPRFEAVKARCNKEMKHIKEDMFRRKRRSGLRNLPLGTDIYGNVYWLFAERSKSHVGWGSWIMCNKAPHLPSPTGSILFPKCTTDKNKDKRDNAEDKMDADNDAVSTASSELSDDLLGNNNNWYSIDNQEDGQQLVKWIKYAAEVTFKKDDKVRRKEAQGSMSSPNNVSESEDNEIYYDDFVQELYSDDIVDNKQSSPWKTIPVNVGATNETIDALAKELLYISQFLPPKESSESKKSKA